MVNESAEVGVITMKLLFCQILSNLVEMFLQVTTVDGLGVLV
jgi:hypothetical protein